MAHSKHPGFLRSVGGRVAAETRVAVLGFGTMGAGIAQVCAQAGYAVVVLETSEKRLADGRRRLDAFLAEGVRRGKTSEDTRAAVLERVRGVTTPAELAGCGWVIEAVVEDLAVKRGLLPEVADAVGEAAIIATNTS